MCGTALGWMDCPAEAPGTSVCHAQELPRRQALQCRKIAEQFLLSQPREQMLQVAAEYEEIAVVSDNLIRDVHELKLAFHPLAPPACGLVGDPACGQRETMNSRIVRNCPILSAAKYLRARRSAAGPANPVTQPPPSSSLYS